MVAITNYRSNNRITPINQIASYFIRCIFLLTSLSGSAGNPLPTEPTVTHGTVMHKVSGRTMHINQTTSRAIVNYDTFDIAADHGVTINQPTSASALLARIAGADRSIIEGMLQANGHVYVSNPNGIIFGQGATIDVGALVATTLGIADSDFLNGVLNFQGDSMATIENRSENISAEQLVGLIAQKVENTGTIHANQIAAAAASEVVVDHAYGGTISVDISGLLGSVNNSGEMITSEITTNSEDSTIIVKGGTVSHSGSALASYQGNSNDGYIEFHGHDRVVIEENALLQTRGNDGFIKVSSGEKGTTLVQGDIKASGKHSGQRGGEVHVLGDRVGVVGNASIDASGDSGGGKVLIGGDYQGSNPNIQKASRTKVSPKATITADALTTGNGGEAIIWSEESTGFYGEISSRGGAKSGNGGLVEISSNQTLDYDGSVNVLAPKGKHGIVLFDPTSGVIADADGADGASDGDILFVDPPGTEPWNLTPTQLEEVKGNVVLQFHDNLTIENEIKLTTAGANFTVEAGDDIVVNASIFTNNGAVSLTANHPSGNEAEIGTTGSITMATGTEISAGNQPIILNAQGDVSLAAVNTAGDVNISSSAGSVIDVNRADVNVIANNLTVHGNEGIDLDTAVSTVNATTSGDGDINFAETDGISLTNVNTLDGSITVEAGGTTRAVSVEANGSGNVVLMTSSGDVMVGSIIAEGNHQVLIDSAGVINGDNARGDADIKASNLEITAVHGIGISDPIELEVENITARTTGSSDADISLIHIGNNQVTLTEVTTQDGSINFVANSSIAIEQVRAQDDGRISGLIDDSHTVEITTISGDIGLQDNGIQADFKVNLSASGNIGDNVNTNAINITSGGDTNLMVGGSLGALNNPLDVDAAESVNFAFSGTGSRAPVWAMLSGTANGSGGVENVHFNSPGREPPGLIVWNGDVIGGESEDLQGLERAKNFYSEVRFLTPERPVFMPAYFRHAMVSMNDLWTIPSIEYLNTGGAFIFGLPKELDLPSSMNVHNAQDEPYRWYSLPLSLFDIDSAYF